MFKLKIDKEKCTGCGNCIIICPVNALHSLESWGGSGSVEEKRMAITLGEVSVYEDFCNGCGECIKSCAYRAIEVIPLVQEVGERLEKVEDVMRGDKKKVYELIRANGPMTITKVADELKISPKETATYIFSLKNDGWLWEYSKENGKYLYATEAAKKTVSEATVEAPTKVTSETAEKIRKEIDAMIKSLNEVKVRFLVETNKVDRAKEELKRKEVV